MTVRTNAPEVAAGIRDFAKAMPDTVLRQMNIWARRAARKAVEGLPESRAKHVRARTRGKAVLVGRSPTAVILCHHKLGLWFEYGTGLFGPNKKRIYPKAGFYYSPKHGFKRRSALMWATPAGPRFAAWSPGIPASPWFFQGIRDQIPDMTARLIREMRLTAKRALRAQGTREKFSGIQGTK